MGFSGDASTVKAKRRAYYARTRGHQCEVGRAWRHRNAEQFNAGRREYYAATRKSQRPPPEDTLQKRFDRFTSRDEKTGCLIWTGTLCPRGYGRMWIKLDGRFKKVMSHRVAWMLAGRDIPPSTPCILHQCDNPRCCEIDHLWVGTKADNNKDRARKGRSKKPANGYPPGVRLTRGRFLVMCYDYVHERRVYVGTYDTINEAASAWTAARDRIAQGRSVESSNVGLDKPRAVVYDVNMKAEDRDKFYASFGRRLSALRQDAGLTQQEFADEIGLSRVSVANIERGRQIIYVDRLPRWAKVLRCRVMDLLPPQWRTSR